MFRFKLGAFYLREKIESEIYKQKMLNFFISLWFWQISYEEMKY